MDDAAIDRWCRAVDALKAEEKAHGAGPSSISLHLKELPPALAARCATRYVYVSCHGSHSHSACASYSIDGNDHYLVIVSREATDEEIVCDAGHYGTCCYFVAPDRCSSPSERESGMGEGIK